MTTAAGRKKRVLIVSFNFPPTSNIAAVRVGKLAKYLPQFGWEPIVLTADNVKEWPQTLPVEIDEANIFRTPYFALDSSLYRNLGGSDLTSPRSSSRKYSWKKPLYKALRLTRPIYTLSIFHPLVSDPIGWYPHAVKKGREILKKYEIDAIFSSYSPSTSHLVASRLQRSSGIPWIAEFRDLWALNPYTRKIPVFQFLEKRLEKRVMKGSSLLIAASEDMAEQLETLHAKKAVTIHNGFDEEDYAENVPLTAKFTITYTGRVYPGKRDPTLLFEAVKELRDEGKVSPQTLDVRFFGDKSLTTLSAPIEKYHLGGMVKICDLVSFKESIKRQKESTVLLLLEWNDPKAKATYTGKLFEYLGAERPILAIAYRGGAINNLLAESGTGVLVDEVQMMKESLSRWLDEWQQLGRIVSYWKPRADVIQRYTRKEQARKLAQLLEKGSMSERSSGINL